jgi:hypothetical protein
MINKEFITFLLLPVSGICQQPNWPSPGNGPPKAPPGLDLDCWPPPCVNIGDYLPIALVITAIVLYYVKYNKEKKYGSK